MPSSIGKQVYRSSNKPPGVSPGSGGHHQSNRHGGGGGGHLNKASSASNLQSVSNTSGTTGGGGGGDEIEIVGEVLLQNQPSQDDVSLSRHVNKTYGQSSANTSGNGVIVNAKPQSNFVNNVTCLNRLLARNDLYASKLRRCKPYSSLRPNAIITTVDRGLGSDDDGELDAEAGGPVNKKVIVIDDSNEEMHKPWISPELIKLIKQRNLLQAKLSEAKSDDAAVNEELMKKFKNLRNKVGFHNLNINRIGFYFNFKFKMKGYKTSQKSAQRLLGQIRPRSCRCHERTSKRLDTPTDRFEHVH